MVAPTTCSKSLPVSLWEPRKPSLLARIVGVPVRAASVFLRFLRSSSLKMPSNLLAFGDRKCFKLILGMTHSDASGSLLGHDSALGALSFE